MRTLVLRRAINAHLSAVFSKECGEPVEVTLLKGEQIGIDVKGRAAFRRALEFARQAGMRVIEGDYDPETRTNWARFDFSALTLLESQLATLVNGEAPAGEFGAGQ